MSADACLDVMIGLPIELTGVLLSAWLHVRDVATTDSAYCNRSKRPHFLRVLALPALTSPSLCNKLAYVNFLQWAMDKEVRLMTVCFVGTDPVYELYSNKFGKHILNLTFTGVGEDTIAASQFVRQCVMCCNNLSSLTIVDWALEVPSAGEFVASLQNCPNLRELRIPLRVPDRTVSTVANSTTASDHQLRLSTLVLGSNLFRCLPVLTACVPAFLQHLEIRAIHPVLSDHLLELFRLFANLTSLSVSNALAFETVLALVQQCPQIPDLTVKWCQNMTSDGAAAIIRSLSQLRSFSLYHYDVDGEYLLALARCHKHTLQSLTVYCCESETARHLDEVLRHCSSLHTLHVLVDNALLFDLSLISNITHLSVSCDETENADFVFESLAPYGSNLQHLYVGSWTLTVYMLRSVHTGNYPNLRTLRLTSYGDNMEDGAFKERILACLNSQLSGRVDMAFCEEPGN